MATFEEAKAKHAENLKTLDDMVKTGKTETSTRFGQAWPNSCMWLTAGKTTLHALTETHDADARATALGEAGKKAMFGLDAAVPTASEYAKDDQTNRANIYLAKTSWLGFRRGGSPSKVVIIEPKSKGKDSVQETIVHEVQHDADHHGTSGWERYATEFRAYWIDGTYRSKKTASGSADSSLAAKDGTVLSGFDNERQQTIFKHLYDSDSYAYVKAGWSDSDFKKKVLDLKKPEGSNLVNSPRIDDLYLELQKPKPDLDKVKELGGKLTKADKQSIQDAGMKATWIKLVEDKFKGDDLKAAKAVAGL